MEMKRSWRATSPSPPPSTAIYLDSSITDRKPPAARTSPRILLGVLLACVLVLLIPVFVLLGSHRHGVLAGGDQATVEEVAGDVHRRRVETREDADHDGTFGSASTSEDKLLGGLLAPGFDAKSCLSRYQSAEYRKKPQKKPSSHLLEKIRNYEALYKRCGPGTEPFGKALDQLRSNQTTGQIDCKYLVWISYSGLGNKIISLVSTFLYALLTDRVLLVDRSENIAELFCEPFPDSTWFLPWDFPISNFEVFNQSSPMSYGSLLKSKFFEKNPGLVPSYLYVHLAHDYDDSDKLFFCGEDQKTLEQVPWTILRSNNYFVPSLFLSPTFQDELLHLFPEKDTVFHHLARYLFHPTNSVWGLITRYYQAYLAKADERIGIQIRVFDESPGPFQHVLHQILACSSKEKLLPQTNYNEPISSETKGKSKAVLITSLSSGYFEMMKTIFWEQAAENGDIIGIFQPSHEEYQQTEKRSHTMKAWAEMYLLSLTDKLVISSWSTFGYVAQGLGGLKSWILVRPENRTVPDPPCVLSMSSEPCFHAPPFYDCKEKRGVDTGSLVPYVRHCEDISWGLKLVNRDEW